MALMILCVTLVSCTTVSPIVVVKGIDYDDGVSNNTPADKTTWMWVTYATAKRQLKWINDNGK